MESIQYGCSVIAIIISMLILEYTLRLERENCECSRDWRRDYIKIFAIITIVFSLLMCFRNFILPRGLKVPRELGALMYLIITMYMIGAFVNVYAMFSYSQKLMCEKNCVCANTWTRDFIYYYSMIVGVTYLLVITLSVVLAIVQRTNPNFISNLRSNLKSLNKKTKLVEKDLKADLEVVNSDLRKEANVAGKFLKKEGNVASKFLKKEAKVARKYIKKDSIIAKDYIKKGYSSAKKIATRGSRDAKKIFKEGVKAARKGIKVANSNIKSINKTL